MALLSMTQISAGGADVNVDILNRCKENKPFTNCSLFNTIFAKLVLVRVLKDYTRSTK